MQIWFQNAKNILYFQDRWLRSFSVQEPYPLELLSGSQYAPSP